jgi:hypothetical protein
MRDRRFLPFPLQQVVGRSRYAAGKNLKIVYNSLRCPFRAPSNKGKYSMNPVETNRFNELYQRHLRLLKLQGKSQKTIDG